MVDFQSHYRLYPHGFTSDPPRVGVKTHREIKHEEGRKLFRKRHDRPVHDCRHDIMKEHTDREEFETWVLSHGLVKTYQAVDELHEKSDEPTPGSKKPDKLLYKIGETGKQEGDFSYPRGICTTMDCDIIVADSMNHRVQHLNQFGVFKKQVGKKGRGQLEFDEPVDVVELANGDIAVADKKNKRVQVLSDDLEFKYIIEIPGEPYSLACDRDMNVAVATTKRQVHVFNCYDEHLTHNFPVGGKNRSKAAPIQISMSNESELYVCDPEDGYVYAYQMTGQLFSRFKPEAHTLGLTMVAGDVCVTPLGQILVVDILNHVVNLYTDKGEFLQQVLTPTDDAGSIHSIALGLEGHLVGTESSIGGDHCVKIFRYRQCPCHESKLPGSKRRTPMGSPNA